MPISDIMVVELIVGRYIKYATCDAVSTLYHVILNGFHYSCDYGNCCYYETCHGIVTINGHNRNYNVLFLSSSEHAVGTTGVSSTPLAVLNTQRHASFKDTCSACV